MGAGDQFMHGTPTNTGVNKLTCTQEHYEIAVGLRCNDCKKLFKTGKRRKQGDCKCQKKR